MIWRTEVTNSLFSWAESQPFPYLKSTSQYVPIRPAIFTSTNKNIISLTSTQIPIFRVVWPIFQKNNRTQCTLNYYSLIPLTWNYIIFPPNNIYAWVLPYEKFQRHETKLASPTADALSSHLQILSASSKYQISKENKRQFIKLNSKTKLNWEEKQ